MGPGGHDPAPPATENDASSNVNTGSRGSCLDASKESVSHEKPAVRHLEKRRGELGSCYFADRIALIVRQHYRQHVLPLQQQKNGAGTSPQPTCVAAIVAQILTTSETAQPCPVHWSDAVTANDRLVVMSIGVGTKFLSSAVLKAEECEPELLTDEHTSEQPNLGYGSRVRDCHAEVLARRAFCRYLTDAIHHDITRPLGNGSPGVSQEHDDMLMLERVQSPPFSKTPFLYRLRSNVTLHLYSSSVPCGNASLKKFAALSKMKFRSDLLPHQWSSQRLSTAACSSEVGLDGHPPMPGHSIRLGEFALLLKRDVGFSNASSRNSNQSEGAQQEPRASAEWLERGHYPIKAQAWPLYSSLSWCPPGTVPSWIASTDGAASGSSIHTCSDKILRWNVLGIQGSLLVSLLVDETPLFLSSVTVGRKFNEVTCRRAFCCRLGTNNPIRTKNRENCFEAGRAAEQQSRKRPVSKRRWGDRTADESGDTAAVASVDDTGHYRINHPAILGTAVLLDESGTIDMSHTRPTGASEVNVDIVDQSRKSYCQDLSFHSSLAFVWWQQTPTALDGNLECIDCTSGFVEGTKVVSSGKVSCSRISTLSLVNSYEEIREKLLPLSRGSADTQTMKLIPIVNCGAGPITLGRLLRLKRDISPNHMKAKEYLLTYDPLLRTWKRRGYVS
jgi:Adenosine-deaminase (editase) domain